MAGLRAFSTLGCPDLDLEQAVALANAHGFSGLELRSLGGTLDLPAWLQKTYGEPRALAQWLEGRGVKIVSLDSSLRLIGGTEADRTALLALVPWAEALGVPYLRVFDGGRQADASELRQAAASLRAWREQRTAEKWKVDVMIETHDSLFTAAAIARFLSACPGARILWDAHHTWRQGGEEPQFTWQQIGRHVVHVHIKDSVSQPSDGLPYTYVPPGEGEFPAAGLLEVLGREFGGAVSLEWERLWHPTLAPLETALRAGAQNGWWK